jgi:hypothetical protein
MRTLYLAASLMIGIPLPMLSQGAARPVREVTGIPTDLYRASNLVTNALWMSGTVLRNVVVIAFKVGVTAEQRSRLYGLVGAHAVYLDPEDGPPPLFYMVVVNADPDACGVRQAMVVLQERREVKAAYPEMVSTFEDNSGLGDVLNAAVGSGRECPSGTELLQNRD